MDPAVKQAHEQARVLGNKLVGCEQLKHQNFVVIQLDIGAGSFSDLNQEF